MFLGLDGNKCLPKMISFIARSNFRFFCMVKMPPREIPLLSETVALPFRTLDLPCPSACRAEVYVEMNTTCYQANYGFIILSILSSMAMDCRGLGTATGLHGQTAHTVFRIALVHGSLVAYI